MDLLITIGRGRRLSNFQQFKNLTRASCNQLLESLCFPLLTLVFLLHMTTCNYDHWPVQIFLIHIIEQFFSIHMTDDISLLYLPVDIVLCISFFCNAILPTVYKKDVASLLPLVFPTLCCWQFSSEMTEWSRWFPLLWMLLLMKGTK